MTAQVPGSLPPTWETRAALPLPASASWLLWALGVNPRMGVLPDKSTVSKSEQITKLPFRDAHLQMWLVDQRRSRDASEAVGGSSLPLLGSLGQRPDQANAQ